MEESERTDELKKLSPAAAAFNRIYELARTLRSPEGCPWDRQQTPLSMRKNLMEETFEAIDAITAGSSTHAKEELGDIFFNTVLTAFMYEQEGEWTIAESLNEVCDKLVRRHPHVFDCGTSSPSQTAATEQRNVREINQQWEKIKETVEGRKKESALDGVAEYFPPLLKSTKMLKKAAKAGFEWESPAQARSKIDEELSEVDEAVSGAHTSSVADGAAGTAGQVQAPSGAAGTVSPSALHLEEEFGDLLLSVVNYARMCGIDASIALDRANRKFSRRFRAVEASLKAKNIPMDCSHLAEMKEAWKEAKK